MHKTNAPLANCTPAGIVNYHKKLILGIYTVCHIPATTD